jgi:hypothetical protein
LNTPRALQPCSSSPISVRVGSAESVVLPVAAPAHVRRAVHGEHAFGGQKVVEHGEDRFLDLARVARAADQHRARCEVEHDRHVRARAVGRRVGLEARQLQDGEVRDEAIELARRRLAEHVAREQGVPGGLGDDPHPALVLRIGADVQVLHEQLALCRVRPGLGPQAARVPRFDRPVDLAPVDAVVHAGLVDDEAVVRGAPGVGPGRGEQRAIRDSHAFAPGKRQLHQGGRRQVPMGPARRSEAKIFEALIIDDEVTLLHDDQPPPYLCGDKEPLSKHNADRSRMFPPSRHKTVCPAAPGGGAKMIARPLSNLTGTMRRSRGLASPHR